VYKILTSDIN